MNSVKLSAVTYRCKAPGREILKKSSGDPCSVRLAVAEVLEVAGSRRAPLALVLRADLAAPVGVVGLRGQLEEADLTDLHLGVDRDRKIGDIRELERQVAFEPRIDVAGG